MAPVRAAARITRIASGAVGMYTVTRAPRARPLPRRAPPARGGAPGIGCIRTIRRLLGPPRGAAVERARAHVLVDAQPPVDRREGPRLAGHALAEAARDADRDGGVGVVHVQAVAVHE